MVNRIGSFFKKTNNDWIKVTISTVIAAVMVIFFSKAVVSSYAYPDSLPDTLTTGQGNVTADRVDLFTSELVGDESISLIPFYATDGNNQYVVYCLEKEKGWSPNQTITKNEGTLDPGYVYLIQNGYPAKSLTNNDAHDEYLTQIAVWWYQDRSNGVADNQNGVLTANQKSVIKASGYYNVIGPLIEGALNAKSNPVTITPTFTLNSSSFKLSSDNTYLITDTINVSANVSFSNYQVSVNNSAVQILDQNNSPVSGPISSGSGFKLKVNLADLDSPISVNVNVLVNYSEYEAYSYSPPSDKIDTMQQSFVSTLVPVAKQKTVSTTVSMPTGSITIRKVDGSNNNALAGANIEVRRAINNKVVETFNTTTTSHTISNLLPGEYIINELSAPTGYYVEDASSNIIVNTTNLNPSTTIENMPFEVYIRKVDTHTGDPVSGAVLRILDSTNREVYRFTSTNSYVSIPNLTEGTYKVEEVSAPPGYILNSKTVEFTINKNNPKVNIDFDDEQNRIIIEKRDASDNNFVSGAVLRLVRVSDNVTIDEWTTGSSGHVVNGLAPGNYKVIEIQAPNGYTLSNSEVTFTVSNNQTEPLTVTFYNSKNRVSIVKVDSETGKTVSGATLRVTDSYGKEVETFTTTDSSHVLSKLAPGTYYVTEIKTPDGYVLDNEPIAFLVSGSTSNLQVQFKNKRNEVRLGKVDEDTGEYVAGATLRLTDSNGEEVETFKSGSDAHIIRGLASGTYTLEEVKSPNGYIRNTKPVPFTIKDTDDVVTYTITNKKTKVTISKIDSETGNAVSGVTLGIYDSKDDLEAIKTFTTTSTPTVITDLNEGTYYVREIRAASGYVLDKTWHEFTLDSKTPEVNITIKNKPITLKLGKIDANTGKYIAGAKMQLKREDGILDPIEFTSTEEPYVVTRIPAGIYSLEEVEPPEGYIGSSSKVVFEVLETGEVQTINISSDVLKITVNNRKLEIDTNGISGYEFDLKDSNGNIIEKIKTTEDNYISGELELGDYRLVETAVPEGVVLNGNAYYFSITDSNTVSVVNFVNDFTKVMISKKDITNSEEVAGAHLVIRNDAGEIVSEWTSSNTPHYIEKLPSGHYTLTETIAPDGYILNTSTVDFEVLANGEIQNVVMFNSKPVPVPNTSSNATYIYLTGGLLIIIGGILIYISRRNKSLLKSR